MRQGTEVSEAGKTAFGSFSELDRELRRYLTQRRMFAFDIPADRLRPGSVELRALKAGEAAAMPLRIRLKNHRSSENIDKLLAEVRTVAAQHPTEAAAAALLAEAEYAAGNDRSH